MSFTDELLMKLTKETSMRDCATCGKSFIVTGICGQVVFPVFCSKECMDNYKEEEE